MLKMLHDQNFAVKPVTHNLFHAFYHLIDGLDFLFCLYFFFTNVHLQLVLHVSVCCQIFTDYYEVNVRITFILVIFPDEHLLDSNLIIRLLRNIYLFISIIVLQCIICFDHQTNHLNIILRHINGNTRLIESGGKSGTKFYRWWRQEQIRFGSAGGGDGVLKIKI